MEKEGEVFVGAVDGPLSAPLRPAFQPLKLERLLLPPL